MELSKIDTLNLEMTVFPSGFTLKDSDGFKYEIDNDSFLTYLQNIDFLESDREYDDFICKAKEDTDIQEKLEEFFYTEAITERFLNGLVPNSYESCFKMMYTLNNSTKPNIAPAPLFDVYEEAQRYYEAVAN
jgi:hypothetical protein